MTAWAAAPRALVGRSADAWLVGGASLAVWLLVVVLERFDTALPGMQTHLAALATMVPTLAVVANYPHFMASYALAYGGGGALVARHWLALVVAPVALMAAFVVSHETFAETLRFGSVEIERFGEQMLGGLVQTMFLAVGWHYAKQTYGCARVGARYRDFRISSVEARLLRYGLLALGAALFVRSNVGEGEHQYFGLRYSVLGFPRWATSGAALLMAGGALLAAVAVASASASQRRCPPSLVVVPVVAMFVWWAPVTHNATFYAAVPFFHSLQYLCFVARIEGERHRRGERRWGRRHPFVSIAVPLVVIGWLVFEGGPGMLDRAAGPSGSLGIAYFTLAFTVFVNVHHYLIDHVIWRFGDPRIKEWLLS